MKPALRWIPTEVWVDIFRFPWIARWKLGRIVHKFRNRKFAEFLQFYLHDWGKLKLKTVCLCKISSIIPRTPIPNNIKFFERIAIVHFDSRAVGFLHHMSTLFTGVDVSLNLLQFGNRTNLTILRTIFDHLAPLLHGIHSMAFDQSVIPLMEEYFAQKLAQIKRLTFKFDWTAVEGATIQTAINFCLNWLISEERDPAESIFLKAYIFWEDFQQFCKAIEQQFLLAKRSCKFAIERPPYFYNDHNIDRNFRLDLQNNLDEQLHGKFDGIGCFRIFRHPVNLTRNQLDEWVKEVKETVWESDKSSVIQLSDHLTIGPLDANAGENEVNYADAEEDAPSTSKKPKLT